VPSLRLADARCHPVPALRSVVSMMADLTFDVWEVVFGLVGAGAIGGLAVALYGWRKTTRGANRLLDLLDVLSETESQLRARLAEFHDGGGDE
jgi:hypothetical protein